MIHRTAQVRRAPDGWRWRVTNDAGRVVAHGVGMRTKDAAAFLANEIRRYNYHELATNDATSTPWEEV